MGTGGVGALRAMELLAESPQVTKQVCEAGVGERDTVLNVAPPALPWLEPSSQGLREACSLSGRGEDEVSWGPLAPPRAFFIWVFGRTLRQTSGVSE